MPSFAAHFLSPHDERTAAWMVFNWVHSFFSLEGGLGERKCTGSLFYRSETSTNGSGQGCPLLRASSDHRLFIDPSKLAYFPSSGKGTHVGLRAAVERGPSQGARSGSTGPTWAPFPSFQARSFSLQGWELIDLPLRASNEGLRRPRVARAQKIIRLHPLLCSASKKGTWSLPSHPFYRAVPLSNIP